MKESLGIPSLDPRPCSHRVLHRFLLVALLPLLIAAAVRAAQNKRFYRIVIPLITARQPLPPLPRPLSSP
ncbi:MAG: hypothetical protein JF599_14040 [Verrucomicrobia bacterium]|nr:hypothetical protein [Verrucomicrobiota bacterium]